MNIAKIYGQDRLFFDTRELPVLNYLRICLFSIGLTIIPYLKQSYKKQWKKQTKLMDRQVGKEDIWPDKVHQ